MKHACLAKLFLLLVLMALPSTTMAQSPWKWKMSLWVDRTGDSMYMPSAIGWDRDSQRYYVVDTGRNRLVSFGKDGEILKAFTANDQLKAPFDMVRLDNGQLWVVEKGRNSLTLIDIAAKKIEHHILRDGPRQVFPDRIAESGGKLFVLDRSGGQILRLNSDLSVDQRFGCSDCQGGLSDFVIDKGSILAIDGSERKIFRFRPDGTIAETIQLGGDIDFPVSLDVGPSGSFYVLDRHKNSVLVYSDKGQFRYKFLSTGQGMNNVYFARQLRFDPWGRLCIVDEGNGRVEIFEQ